MPKVTIADYNTTVTFPDDMPQEQIRAVLQKNFPQKDDAIDGVPAWGRENPNLYGAYGAVKETAKKFIPYLRYLDPKDREEFVKKNTQGQTRELLMEVLNTELMLAAGPVAKAAGEIGGALFPAATKVLTKQRSVLPSGLEDVMSKEPIVAASRPIVIPKEPVANVPKVKTPTSEIVQPEATSVEKTVVPNSIVPEAVSEKPSLPRQDVMGLEEQKNVIQKIIQEGIVDKERPYVADETQRAMYNIADTITKYPEYGREILAKYNITAEELSSEILKAGTVHGKGLNQFSQWARAMKQAFPDDPVIQDTLGKVAELEPITWWDKIKNVYRAVDDKRRMLMVTQIATAARNVESQGMRYGVGILDDALQGVFKTATGVPQKEAFANFMSDWTAIMGRMSPKQRANLESVLNKYPESKAEMLSTPIHDITLGGKVSNALMYLNRTQEYFFRKMMFDSRITAWGKIAGKDPYSSEIPESVLNNAVKTAMEYTFSAPQNEGFGKGIMDAYKAIPMLTTIHPYPRFWTNAVKFLWDFNPTGYLSAAARSKFFSKNPKDVYQAASRATIGTLMLGAGIEMRNSEYAGEKWYEINVGNNRYIDARPFAPFSTYLFLGEAISHPEKLSGRDWAEGALSISRIAGTGLMLVDLLRSESLDSMKKILQGFAGQYMGGFTVPLRSVKDLTGEGTNLSTRESPFLGPAASNVPVVGGQMLHPQPSITRGGPSEREQTQLRQLTGITVKTKTPLEREIDKLNIQGIYPRTGDATLDRLVTEYAGPLINFNGTRMMQMPQYQAADNETKKYMLTETLSKIKEEVRKKIAVRYYEGNLQSQETASDRYDYLKGLVDKKRISQEELVTIFANNSSALPDAKKTELLKKLYLK